MARTTRIIAAVLVVAVCLALAACIGPGGLKTTPAVPSAFEADAAKGVDFKVDAKGSGVALRSGDATAGIYVPEGAARASATWRVTPLTKAPEGAKKALCPGLYVDTTGADPTKPCTVGFMLPGKAAANATIVRIAQDGKAAEIVPTDRMDYGGSTFLTAYVDGFSAYTTSEEDKEAIDQAFQEREKAKGKQVDWTIKALGTETQTAEGWTFNYEFDLFASGGGVSQGGSYKGYAQMYMTGKYKGPAGIVSSFGDIKASGRDSALQFTMTDAPMTKTLTGEPPSEAVVAGFGTMNGEGLGQLNIAAVGPTMKGEYKSGDVSGSSPLPFMIKVTTFEDVLVEIPNVGVFPGKILRTSK